MATAFAVAQAKAPDATIVVVGQPEYEDGHLCKILGNTLTQHQNALAKVRAAVAHAVSIGAELGPTLPELGPTTTRDGCHANGVGESLLGDALFAWEEAR